MKSDQVLREQLVALLKGGHAHMSFSDAVKDFPEEHINTFAPHVEYSFWHIVEHIRLTQRDIIDFIKDPNYKEPKWPEGYWPKKSAKATKAQWNNSVKAVEKDIEEMIALVEDPKIDLSQKVPYGDGQTYLREAFLVADHNAYEIGEFAILRQVMNTWPKDHR